MASPEISRTKALAKFPGSLGPGALRATPGCTDVRFHFTGGTASVVLTGKIADTCSDTSLTGG